MLVTSKSVEGERETETVSAFGRSSEKQVNLILRDLFPINMKGIRDFSLVPHRLARPVTPR